MLGVVHALNNFLVEMEDIYKVIVCKWDMEKCCIDALAKIVGYVFMHKNLSLLICFRNYKIFLIMHLNLTCRKNRVMKTH